MVRGSQVLFPAEAHIFILNFRFIPVAHSSAKPLQMKSSMAFIQNHGCKEIDLSLNENGDGLYYDTPIIIHHIIDTVNREIFKN